SLQAKSPLNSLRVPEAPATTSRPFQSFGSLKRNRAWPCGSEAMRALSCTPGTAFVIGVRLPAAGAMTPRSVCGVKAPGASVVIELSAGVVCVPLVVRSALTKQVASSRRSPKAFSTSPQLSPARAENETTSNSAAAPQIRRTIISPCWPDPDGRMHVSARLGNHRVSNSRRTVEALGHHQMGGLVRGRSGRRRRGRIGRRRRGRSGRRRRGRSGRRRRGRSGRRRRGRSGRRRRGWREDELPVGIFLRAFQARVAQLEARDLERLVFGEAVDTADAAVGPLHEAPFALAGYRVGIELAQVALYGRLARVLEQVLERARVLGFPCEHVA